MEQADLIEMIRAAGGQIPPHQSHSDTSIAAAVAAANTFGPMTAELLVNFTHELRGLTDEEGQEKYEIEGNSYRPMRVMLFRLGLVTDSGIRRRNRSGREAVVWAITELGGKVARKEAIAPEKIKQARKKTKMDIKLEAAVNALKEIRETGSRHIWQSRETENGWEKTLVKIDRSIEAEMAHDALTELGIEERN